MGKQKRVCKWCGVKIERNYERDSWYHAPTGQVHCVQSPSAEPAESQDE